MARRFVSRVPLRGIVVVAMFTFMLMALFYMAHDPVPTLSHNIGWQAFDSISLDRNAANLNPGMLDAENGAGEGTVSDGTKAGDGTPAIAPSFPLDQYRPLLPNPAPLTAITVHNCMFYSKTCAPPSDPATDARLGKWVMVDRQLDPAGTGTGWLAGLLGQLGQLRQPFIFYRRSRRLDVEVVTDIRLVETGGEHPPGWYRAKNDLRSPVLRMMSLGGKGLHLYYRTRPGTKHKVQPGTAEQGLPNFSQGNAWAEKDPITEIDLVYGNNPVWWSFERIGSITESDPSLGHDAISLVVRRRPIPLPTVPEPTFHSDGTFKIMQLADEHLSVDSEKCRDTLRNPCVADNDTTALVERWLDDERPDLVVLSGDQLNGQGTSWDEKSVLPKVMKPLIDRKIPWCAIFGNHDSEAGPLSRSEQMLLVQNMPYSLSKVGPSLSGVGNYFVKLFAPDASHAHLFTLYFLDSGTHAPLNPLKPWEGHNGYGWIQQDQIDWFVKQVRKVKPILKPHRPDGANDLGPQWTRRERRFRDRRDPAMSRVLEEPERRQDQSQKLGKPAAITFFHIPLPEAFDTPDRDAAGKEMVVGQRKEKATIEGTQKEKGFFQALLDLESERDTQVIVNGHMHNDADCRRIRGVWNCFGGGSSYAGYGLPTFPRRTRIFQLSNWGTKITTWHRFEPDSGAGAGAGTRTGTGKLGPRVDETVLYEE